MASDTKNSRRQQRQQSLLHSDQTGERTHKGVRHADRKAQTERLTLDLDRDLYQRVKLVAARQHVSMRALIERMLEERLPTLVFISRFSEGRLHPVSQESVSRLATAREAIMRGRRFDDDSADLIREARDERDAGLNA